MSYLQDASTARGKANRVWARDLIARLTTDPIAMAISERTCIIDGTATAIITSNAFLTDAHGNPSESVNLEQYARVMAERERLRRLAE